MQAMIDWSSCSAVTATPHLITDTGPTSRSSPLDRVFADNKFGPRVTVMQADAENFARAKALSDHVPIFIHIAE